VISTRSVLAQSAVSATLAALILAAMAYVLPQGSRGPLIETGVWSVLLMVAFAGWGSVVRAMVAPRERIDLGLRMAWGAAAMCFVGGALMVPSLMTRAAALLMGDAGVVAALVALAREREFVRVTVGQTLRAARGEPGIALIALAAVFVVVIQFLSGIADWHINPYDDDMAYVAFVKRLLDTGSILEPFSLRRLSALGGQTFFHELVALRAVPNQYHTFDRSISVAMVAALIVGHRAGARRAPLLVTVSAVVFFVTLQNMAINTASYYSGVVFFLALFRTLDWAGRASRAPWQNALPLALLGAAACTLRQNYFPVPVVMLAASYTFRMVAPVRPGERRAARLVEPALAAGFSLAALVPWFVVGWQSNRTFFYPVILGTANPALVLHSYSTTLFKEVHLAVWTALEGTSIHVLGMLVVAAVLVREAHPRRPLWSLGIGSVAGVLALVHGFTQGDAGNIGRYAFGFVAAFALAVVLTTGLSRFHFTRGRVGQANVAAAIAFLAMLAQLVNVRAALSFNYARAFANIDALSRAAPRSAATYPPERYFYGQMQEAVPEGQRLAVLLDEPHWLDYGRNPIWNLDMPGYTSLPPGIPYFAGSKAVEDYFRGLGVRYLAYVRPGFSRYHYRREYWLEMIVSEQELWRAHAPYVIDFLDNLEEIRARHRRPYEDRGMAVVDLGEGGS